MRKLSKILVLVLTLSLLLGIFAVFASANTANVAKIGDTEYATLEQAWAAALASAEAEVEIDLIADAEVATQLRHNAPGKHITLDLNWYTLNYTNETNGTGKVYTDSTFSVCAEGATLTVKNGTVASANYFVVTGASASDTGMKVNVNVNNVDLDWANLANAGNYAFYLSASTTLRVDNFVVNSPMKGRFLYLYAMCDVEMRNTTAVVSRHLMSNDAGAAVNGTKVSFYDSNLLTTGADDASNRGRAFELSGYDLTSNHYTVDENNVVTPAADAPSVNLYNTSVATRANQMFRVGAFQINLYGGYYMGDRADASNRDIMFEPNSDVVGKGYGQVILHSYEVDGETYYPTFRTDPRLDADFPVVGIVDGVMTATKDGETVTAITTSASTENATGKVYATSRGWAWIPNTDTEAIAAVKADYTYSYQSQVLAYQSVQGTDGAGQLRGNGYTLDHKSVRAGTNHGIKDPATNIVVGTNNELVAPGVDPNGNIYYSFTWTDNLPEGWATRDDYENWGLTDGNATGASNDVNVTMNSVDYFTIDFDVRDPRGDGYAWFTGFLYAPAAGGTRPTLLSKNNLKKAVGDDYDSWHHITFVFDLNQSEITKTDVSIFVDGVKFEDKTITHSGTLTAALGYLRINYPAMSGTNIKGSGLELDNYTVQLYGYNKDGAKDYQGTLDNVKNVTNLSELTEYADYLYNETYRASIGTTYYTSFEAAYEAAQAGDVIELYANVGVVPVEKAVTVLANGYEFSPVSETMMYDRTGTDGRAYNFSTAPAKHLARINYYNDDATLIKDYNAWDFSNAAYTDTLIYNEEIIEILENNGPTVGEYVYDKEGGKITKITGWKYNSNYSYVDLNDEVVLNFVCVSDDIDVSEVGYIVLDANENLISYGGTSILDLIAAVEGAQADTTIRLLCDFKFTDPGWKVISPVKNLTLDLNGKMLSFVGNESGDQPRGLRFNAPGEITIKNGTVVLASIDGDAGQYGDAFVWVTNGALGSTVTLEDVNFYGCRAVQVHNNAGVADTQKTTVNVIGGQYVRVAADGQSLFALMAENVEFTATNADIVSPGYVVSFSEAGSEATEALQTTATFTNCSILVGENGGNIVNTKNTSGDDQKNAFCTLTIENCYVHGVANSVGGSKVVVLGESNFFTKSPEYTSLGEGVELSLIDELVLHTDEIPDITVAADHNHVFGKQTIDCSFIYTTSKNLVTVTWTDGENVLATEKVLAGDAATYTDSKVDGIYKTTYTGKSAELTENATVAATATLAVEATGLLHNLSLANEMSINLAIPAAAWAELKSVTVGGVPLEGTLMSIGGADYYLVSFDGVDAVSTTDAVDFVLAGNNENAAAQTVSLSVASYAEKLLKDGADDVEKELARAILAYTLAAHNLLAAEDVEAIAELTALLEGTTAPEAKTSFAGAVNTMVNVTVLTGGSLRLDAAPAFVIYLAEGVTEDTVVTVSYESANDGLVEKTVTLNATNNSAVLMGMKVYDLDNTLTVKVGDQVGTYNLAAYLNGLCSLAADDTADDALNEAFANALYNYVVAAEEYRGIFDEPVVEE